MSDLTIDLATKQDLAILNRLYAEMDNKPLISEEQIIAIWNQIQQVPN